MRDAMLRWEKTELKGISGKMDQISFGHCKRINPTEHRPTEIRTKMIDNEEKEIKGSVQVAKVSRD
jgi:hypothetical protein